MDTLNIFNLIITLIIIELFKNIFINNYYVNVIFFKIIKFNSNLKDLFNCLFNLFFFLTVIFCIIWLILYYPIFLLLKIKLFLFIFPIITLNIFFLILVKFFKKSYFFLNILIYFFYLTSLIINYKTESFHLFIILFYLINFFQILIAFLLLKNKIYFKINLEYLLDSRASYFAKKFLRFIFKFQLYRVFILIFLIFTHIKFNS
jgi:hypothetical protein